MEIEDYLKYQSGLKKDIIGTDGVAQCATWKGKPGPCKIETFHGRRTVGGLLYRPSREKGRRQNVNHGELCDEAGCFTAPLRWYKRNTQLPLEEFGMQIRDSQVRIKISTPIHKVTSRCISLIYFLFIHIYPSIYLPVYLSNLYHSISICLCTVDIQQQLVCG